MRAGHSNCSGFPKGFPAPSTCWWTDLARLLPFPSFNSLFEIRINVSRLRVKIRGNPYSCVSSCRPPLFSPSASFFLFASLPLPMVQTAEARRRYRRQLALATGPEAEARKERERELNRQRQRRHRARLTAAAANARPRTPMMTCMNPWSSTLSNTFFVSVLLTTGSSNAALLPSLYPFLRAPLPRRTSVE